jgi:two-component system, chemotaxis family, chemotaxis protein CheY
MKRVLIVDDSATVRQQVRVALTEAGFDVVEAVDGEDGLLKLRTDAEIRAVICDINMPRKSGLDLLEELRRGDSNALVPVLMLTSEGQSELIQRAKVAGAKGWMVKPFKPHLLVAALQKLTA